MFVSARIHADSPSSPGERRTKMGPDKKHAKLQSFDILQTDPCQPSQAVLANWAALLKAGNHSQEEEC